MIQACYQTRPRHLRVDNQRVAVQHALDGVVEKAHRQLSLVELEAAAAGIVPIAGFVRRSLPRQTERKTKHNQDGEKAAGGVVPIAGFVRCGLRSEGETGQRLWHQNQRACDGSNCAFSRNNCPLEARRQSESKLFALGLPFHQ